MNIVRPVLKPSIEVLEASDGDIYLLRNDGRPDLRLRAPDRAARALLRALRRGGTIAELERIVAPERDAASDADVAAIVEQLVGAGVVTDGETEAPLADNERRRFDRQLHYFTDMLPQGTHAHQAQRALGKATVAVLGVGGLGTWTAAALAQTGVGRLILVDDDVVDDSNLNRQVLFGEGDLGRRKATVAARRIAAMTSLTVAEPVVRRLDGIDAIREVVAEADVVVATADRPVDKISTWVDEACRLEGVPHVAAGQFPPRIRVGPFVIPGRTPGICCLHAALRATVPLFDELQAARARDSAPAATVAGPSAVIGGLQATDIMHFLTGVADPATLGRAAVLDLRTLGLTWQVLPEDACERCSRERAPVIERAAAALA